MLTSLPFLDLADPAFSTRSSEVSAAREAHWCARTPYGLAVLRYREVGALLRDRRFRQGSHSWPAVQGLTGPFADFWMRSVISREGKAHRALRDLAVPSLSSEVVAGLTPEFDRIAVDLCDDLARSEACEFMRDFATPFAGRAISTLLGIDSADWRDIARDASALGLAMGVACKQHEPVFNAACERLFDLAQQLVSKARRGDDRHSYVAALVSRHAGSGLDEQALLDLIVISIFGGVDTTRAQLGLGMSLFLDHPEQWTALQNDLSLAPQAVEEIIRNRPTTTWVTREAVEDVSFGGIQIARGTTLHLLVHASAHDPAVCDAPGFDITLQRKRHFGFGGGAHHCLGHLVARTDIACALKALAGMLRTIEPDGPATWQPDSGNTGPITLPMRYAVSRV